VDIDKAIDRLIEEASKECNDTLTIHELNIFKRKMQLLVGVIYDKGYKDGTSKGKKILKKKDGKVIEEFESMSLAAESVGGLRTSLSRAMNYTKTKQYKGFEWEFLSEDCPAEFTDIVNKEFWNLI
jgi:hypothetical protein